MSVIVDRLLLVFMLPRAETAIALSNKSRLYHSLDWLHCWPSDGHFKWCRCWLQSGWTVIRLLLQAFVVGLGHFEILKFAKNCHMATRKPRFRFGFAINRSFRFWFKNRHSTSMHECNTTPDYGITYLFHDHHATANTCRVLTNSAINWSLFSGVGYGILFHSRHCVER